MCLSTQALLEVDSKSYDFGWNAEIRMACRCPHGAPLTSAEICLPLEAPAEAGPDDLLVAKWEDGMSWTISGATVQTYKQQRGRQQQTDLWTEVHAKTDHKLSLQQRARADRGLMLCLFISAISWQSEWINGENSPRPNQLQSDLTKSLCLKPSSS